MKKLLSGSYYIVLLLGVLFVVGSFLFAKNETHFRKGEIAGHQQITPQSITQVDEMTKEYVFSGEQFTGKNICLAFYSIHLGIEVYEDGELIYDLKPVPGIFGTTPGSVWNFLEIEPGCGQVIVRTHAAYRRVGGETLSFYIGEAVDEVLYLIRNSAIGACVCLLELAIGIFLIMYFIIGNKGIRIENYVLYFGLFAVLMGAWSLNETVLMALLVKNAIDEELNKQPAGLKARLQRAADDLDRANPVDACFVYAAGLHADNTVFHDVDDADTVLAAQSV